jgi:hypothetical protein
MTNVKVQMTKEVRNICIDPLPFGFLVDALEVTFEALLIAAGRLVASLGLNCGAQ